MSDVLPIDIRSNGNVINNIVCPNVPNSINGSLYRQDNREILINQSNVNLPPTVIDNLTTFNGEEYQCFTLSSSKENEFHNLKANRDCSLNFILIGSGAPGGNNGSYVGGNAGSVISGIIDMKENESFDVSISNSNKEINSFEWLGKDVVPQEIGGDINIESNVTQYSISSIIKGGKWSIIAGGALWPNQSNNVQERTNVCQVIGLGDDVSIYYPNPNSSYVSNNFTIHKINLGGMNSLSSGLTSGYYDENINNISYDSVNILGNQYVLPCSGGGGGKSLLYSVNYNSLSISYQFASNSFAGCSFAGGGYGNLELSQRIVDAWMPGCGGGGSYLSSSNEEYLNGYGAQGAMICWVKI